MKTSKDFAREIRENYGVRGVLSDYALAKLLNITRSAISSHTTGRRSVFADETGQRIAELLDLDPAYVLACLAAERAKRPDVRATWQRVAEQFEQAKQAARVAIWLIVLGLAGLSHSPDTLAAPRSDRFSTSPCYTLCAVRLLRALRACWAALWPRLPLHSLCLTDAR